jgi:hypothetical protein
MRLLQRFFAVVAVVVIAGCGRSDLNAAGFSTQNVSTGASGGGSTSTGASGGGSTSTGASGGGSTSTGASGGGSTGSAGVTGGGGSGTGGATGAGAMSGGITCGGKTCAAGTETCCVQTVGGNLLNTCIANGAPCVGGGNVGCVAGGCGAGSVCCLSLVGMVTGCSSAAQCSDGVSTILCKGNADCPADRRFCCPAIGINLCRSYGCPRN